MMITDPTSCINEQQFDWCKNKKFISNNPTYVCFHNNINVNKYTHGWNHKVRPKSRIQWTEPSTESMKHYEIVIRINCALEFHIKDVMGWCDNEGGVYKYQYEPEFINNAVDISNCDILLPSNNNMFHNATKIYLNNNVFIDYFFFTENSLSNNGIKFKVHAKWPK